MRKIEVWVQLQCLPLLRDRLVVLPCHEECEPQEPISGEREWIKFQGSFGLHNGFFKAPRHNQSYAIKIAGVRVACIKLNRSLEFSLGA